MSWLNALSDTYDLCSANAGLLEGKHKLLPLSHTSQQAHIEIVLDGLGNFLRANIVNKEQTLIPATEESAGRTSGPVAHPLADKIQYCAADYPEFGGKKDGQFQLYLKALSEWCDSPYSHRVVQAVYTYVSKKSVVRDLVKNQILVLDTAGVLITRHAQDDAQPPILKVLTKQDGEFDQGSALVRWVVEVPGSLNSKTWEDESLIKAWQSFDRSRKLKTGLCYVSGKVTAVAEQHPANIRRPGDKAKLISSNDKDGYTFRGRFTESVGSQACEVGFEVSQKAHSALRWLIARQSYRSGDQVVVTWTKSGRKVPQPLASTFELFSDFLDTAEPSDDLQSKLAEVNHDLGQGFALQLTKLIAGYSAKLPSSEGVIVMGVDSATPGRMAITYYQELTGSDFFTRIERWHSICSWPQRASVQNPDVSNRRITIWRTGAPSPREIAETAYGRRLDEKLLKSTIARLLPCIVEDRQLPRDLVESVVRRVANPNGFSESWEWNHGLGIACAVYRAYWTNHPNKTQRREYSMALEPERGTRDYLYGRLLALAEHIEEVAQNIAREQRDTTAAKLMQRFADRPCSTWRTIETSIAPYKARFRAKYPGYWVRLAEQLDSVFSQFDAVQFTDESRLSGEFLLGYHCQRQELKKRWERAETDQEITTEEVA